MRSGLRTRNGRTPSQPARLPVRHADPRWHGDPEHRPLTDAEAIRSQLRQRTLVRLGLLTLAVGAIWFAAYPAGLLSVVTTMPAPFTELGATLLPWLIAAHPMVRGALAMIAGWIVLHAAYGAWSLTRQIQRQRQRVMDTLLIELPRTAAPEIGAAIEWHMALHGILTDPSGTGAGVEDVVALAISNSEPDHLVRIAVRYPRHSRHADAYAAGVRALAQGIAPGCMVRTVTDDLATALTDQATRGGILGIMEYALSRPASYPLKDLPLFVTGDPLGFLTSATQRPPGVRYSGYEIVLRAVPPREDWRAPLRERMAMIAALALSEDKPAYDALERKVQHQGFDVVIRCIVIGDAAKPVCDVLYAMHAALAQFQQAGGTAAQRLIRRGSRRPGRHPGITLIPLTPLAIPGAAYPPTSLAWHIGHGVGALAGAAVGYVALPGVLKVIASMLPALPITPVVTIPITVAPWLLGGLGAIAGALSVAAATPARRWMRRQQRIAMLLARAHRPLWPGRRMTFFPAPATRRSILGPYELAALWHIPTAEVELMAWRSCLYLPPPAHAFLAPDEQRAAETQQVLPPPRTPLELAQRRLGLAYAYRSDGSKGLIGPTVRDLRQGWDVLGSMGSGKSTLIENLVAELARVGSGFGVIDAKGDLCDRILRLLPPDAQQRVIYLDTTAEWVPCINPLDRRILGAKPREVVAAEIGQIFARIEPEIWAGAMGMQEMLFKAVAAVLDAEPTPTLLHVVRFLESPAYHQRLLAKVTDPEIATYWQRVPDMPDMIKKSLDSLKRRLTLLIGAETGQRLLCQPWSSIDLTAAMRERAIVLIKFVPEKIGDSNAAFWGAAIFQSIMNATFAQQAESDPEQRWDWPLIVDEVQMFVRAEEAQDAERMWTRTRSMGVGLIGAHQSLQQLGEKLGSIVLSVIGGLALTSGVKDETAIELAQAYAHQGVTPDDFAGIQPRTDLLLRFPLGGCDTGLMSAVPRPPVQPMWNTAASAPTTTPLPAGDTDRYGHASADDEAILSALEAHAAQLAATSAYALESIARRVAHEWVQHVYTAYANALADAHPTWSVAERHEATWEQVEADIAALRAAARRRGEREAQRLLEAGELAGPLHERVARASMYRYGIHPIVNACYVMAFLHRYPGDASLFASKPRRNAGRAAPASSGAVPNNSGASTAGGAAGANGPNGLPPAVPPPAPSPPIGPPPVLPPPTMPAPPQLG